MLPPFSLFDQDPKAVAASFGACGDALVARILALLYASQVYLPPSPPPLPAPPNPPVFLPSPNPSGSLPLPAPPSLYPTHSTPHLFSRAPERPHSRPLAAVEMGSWGGKERMRGAISGEVRAMTYALDAFT